MRIFISVDIPEEIKEEILKIQDKLPESYGGSEQSSGLKRGRYAILKKTEAENLHLTLKFLGEISDEKVEVIREKLRGVKYGSFETEIDSLGVFSPKFIKILWLHLTNCEGLQKIVDESLGDLFAREKRFMSHLTIARVKKIDDKELFLEKLKQIKIPDLKFKVDAFYLMESRLSEKGPKYSVIEEYKLNL